MKGKQQQNQLNKILFQAIKENSLTKAIFALKSGASINGKDESGNNAIHLAIANNNKNAVEFCIKNNGDYNFANKKGSTPLHLAVSFKRIEIVKLLVKQSYIDLNAQEKVSRLTPLGLAEFLGDRKDIIFILKNGGAN